MRERFSAAPRLGPRPVGGLGQGSGVLQGTAPSPSVHLLIQGSISYLNPHLLPHSPPDEHHSINRWLSEPPMAAHGQQLSWGGPYCSSNQWLRGTINGRSLTVGLPRGFSGKESACNAGDVGLTLGLGRSPGEGNGNSLQFSCLGNPMDRGAWWAPVHAVAKSQARLSD